jgi:hypothetical protein
VKERCAPAILRPFHRCLTKTSSLFLLFDRLTSDASTIGLHVAYDPLSLRVSKEHGWIP